MLRFCRPLLPESCDVEGDVGGEHFLEQHIFAIACPLLERGIALLEPRKRQHLILVAILVVFVEPLAQQTAGNLVQSEMATGENRGQRHLSGIDLQQRRGRDRLRVDARPSRCISMILATMVVNAGLSEDIRTFPW